MSLKEQMDSGSGYAVPDTKAYENSLYKETAYGYEAHRRYLGLSLGNLVSVVVLTVLFLLLVGVIVVVWQKNVVVNVCPCFDLDEQLSPPPSSLTLHGKTTPRVGIDVASKVNIEMSSIKQH